MIDPIPSGTRDVLPDEMRELRAITEKVRAVFEARGYGEVATPALEYEEVLRRGDERAVCEMARGVIANKAFTQREWAHIYNRDEFNALRDALIKLGYAAWRDPDDHKLSAYLLPPGRALFRALAEPTPPPAQGETP